jgi:hypothetical protein
LFLLKLHIFNQIIRGMRSFERNTGTPYSSVVKRDGSPQSSRAGVVLTNYNHNDTIRPKFFNGKFLRASVTPIHSMSPTMSFQSPSRSFYPAVGNGTRSSTDSNQSTSASAVDVNGAGHHNDNVDPDQDQDGADGDAGDPDMDPIERLQRRLARERAEKDELAAQYRNLLAKLTTVRTTLGNKLKQDAVCPLSLSF